MDGVSHAAANGGGNFTLQLQQPGPAAALQQVCQVAALTLSFSNPIWTLGLFQLLQIDSMYLMLCVCPLLWCGHRAF